MEPTPPRFTELKTVGQVIEEAAKHGIELSPSDFQIFDGVPHLDGMLAYEWLDAMTMD